MKTEGKELWTIDWEANRIEAFGILMNTVGCVLFEGMDGWMDIPDRFNKAPSGFRGRRQVLKFNLEVGQMFSSGQTESGHTLVAGFME